MKKKDNKERSSTVDFMLFSIQEETSPLLQPVAEKKPAEMQALANVYTNSDKLETSTPVFFVSNQLAPMITDAKAVKFDDKSAEELEKARTLFNLHNVSGKPVTPEQLQLITALVDIGLQQSCSKDMGESGLPVHSIMQGLLKERREQLEAELEEIERKLQLPLKEKQHQQAEQMQILLEQQKQTQDKLGSIEPLTNNYGTSSNYIGYTLYALATYCLQRHPSAKELLEIKKRMAELQLLRAYRVKKDSAGEYYLSSEPIVRMLVHTPLPKINGKNPSGRVVREVATSRTAEIIYWLELAPVLSLKAGYTPMLAKSFELPSKALTMRLKTKLAGLADNKGNRVRNPYPMKKQELLQVLAGDIGAYYSKGILNNPARLQRDWQEAVQACIDEKYIKEQALPSGAVIPAYEEKPNKAGEIICIFGLNRTYLKDNGINTAGTTSKRRGRPKKAPAATTTPPTKKRGRPRKTAPQSGKK